MRALLPFLLLCLVACKQQDPPGASRNGKVPVFVGANDGSAPMASASGSLEAKERTARIGTAADNLPFEPTGDKIASIAWRTWVYTDTGPARTRYGYLRAGAVVERRGPAIRNEGCAEGWYRINPRGFVCVGKGATLDLNHPVVVAARRRPERGAGLPYYYVLAADAPPHIYFRLPSASEMVKVEGGGVVQRAAAFRATAETNGLWDFLGKPGEPPPFVSDSAALPKPYGAERRLHYTVSAGQAAPESGFALGEIFVWQNRLFGLSTELDVIPLDHTKIVVPSAFHGAALGEGEDLPVAIVNKRWAPRYERAESGQMKTVGAFEYRQVLKLTGNKINSEGVSFWESRDGAYIPSSTALILQKRESYPSVSEGNRKWIDVSINAQTLVAYEGTKAVYVTLVSTGLAGLADPEKAPATVRGTFMVHAKHVTATMDGDDDVADSFSLRDVPFVQYFHKGYALHGAYWHDEFGKVRSHGCINLAPLDAAWLFEWTDPPVPPGWHASLNSERGTAIHIHP